jgi:hypothetical protein
LLLDFGLFELFFFFFELFDFDADLIIIRRSGGVRVFEAVTPAFSFAA